MAASKPTSRQHRSPPAGHSEAPPYRARLAAAIAAVTSIGRWMPHSQARWASVLAPATFPGWSGFSVSGLFAFVLRLGYIDPAESFAFPLPACTSPTSKRAGYSFQPVSGFMLRNACNPPLATSGDQPGSVVVAPRRRFDVGPRLSGVSCWWPEVIPGIWGTAFVRPQTNFPMYVLRITTAHSPTRKRAIHAACLWVRPGFGVATHAPVQFCTPALFLVGPGHLRGPGYGRFQGGS